MSEGKSATVYILAALGLFVPLAYYLVTEYFIDRSSWLTGFWILVITGITGAATFGCMFLPSKYNMPAILGGLFVTVAGVLYLAYTANVKYSYNHDGATSFDAKTVAGAAKRKPFGVHLVFVSTKKAFAQGVQEEKLKDNVVKDAVEKIVTGLKDSAEGGKNEKYVSIKADVSSSTNEIKTKKQLEEFIKGVTGAYYTGRFRGVVVEISVPGVAGDIADIGKKAVPTLADNLGK
jgi:hypothetical protein